MAGMLAGIAACFHSSSMANSFTTALQLDTRKNGAPQPTTSAKTGNGDFVTFSANSFSDKTFLQRCFLR